MRPFGVSVHIIEPGYFATNITDPERLKACAMEAYNQLSPEIQQAYGQKYAQHSMSFVISSTDRYINKS